MIPSVGRIVHYTLTQLDADRAKNARLADPNRLGNEPREGDVCPLLIVRAWGDTEESVVNGQIFLDGNDTLWAMSVGQGEGVGKWREPPRV